MSAAGAVSVLGINEGLTAAMLHAGGPQLPVRIVARCDEGCFSDCLGRASPSAALAALSGDIIYLEQDLTFTKPVRPDDTVTAIVEVVDDLGDDRIRVETIAETDDVVLKGEAVVLSVAHGDR